MPFAGIAILIIAAGAGIGEVVFSKGLADGASDAENKLAVGASIGAALAGVALIVYAHKKGQA